MCPVLELVLSRAVSELVFDDIKKYCGSAHRGLPGFTRARKKPTAGVGAAGRNKSERALTTLKTARS
ncbi:hypothetical protein AGR13a_Lc100189 [Agrobacterium genomosp. 13 str. CFBP 6927]|uniref:Transposase n=1 Tax=Agrobacterium genomosp. 13 str. CFBP 6927 TaxID=1183428 RepID=A0ABM9VJR8_9HYPH|nr:hypothetical protein AGR13a_Lc100189 [Agrobacterium genomosp. 13 str. CFBP 6927]